MKKIVNVCVDTTCGKEFPKTYYIGQEIITSDDGSEFIHETIKSFEFGDLDTGDLIIQTEQGSSIVFNYKYVVSWKVK